jgi:hypothetical protein
MSAGRQRLVMSIIFEALKKIEAEKEGPHDAEVPLSFAPPEGERRDGRRAGRGRHAVVALAAVSVAAFSLLIIRPDLWGLVPSRRPAPAAEPASAAAPPVIREVRIPDKSILPFSEEPAPSSPAPSAGREAEASEDPDITLPGLRLKGVSHGSSRSWAFINNKMLKAGDSIDGADVVEILSDRVKMRYRGVDFTLTY